jgi:hypothetical protein
MGWLFRSNNPIPKLPSYYEMSKRIWDGFIGMVKVRDHVGDLDVNGRMIIKRILKTRYVRLWTGIIWLRIGSSVGLL